MANLHKDVTIPPEDWPGLLTPELEEHFEHIGEELVSRDVSAHRYATPGKHFAALHWLGEKRRKRDSREGAINKVVWATLIVAALTLIATLIV